MSTIKILKVRSASGLELVRLLHSQILPSDSWDDVSDHEHWLVWDTTSGFVEPIGFASACVLKNESGVFLSRAGVNSLYAGGGIHRRLIQARLVWAKRRGKAHAVTYVATHNFPSFVNLLYTGFRIYEPARYWAGKDVFYLYKMLGD